MGMQLQKAAPERGELKEASPAPNKLGKPDTFS
jgi:hypothetical protein